MNYFKRLSLILMVGIVFYYISFSIFRGTSAVIEEPVNPSFDDINFYKCVIKQYKSENFSSSSDITYETNLTDEQLASIKNLWCPSLGVKEEEKIVSVKGIEKLVSVKEISLVNNKIENIDVSNNAKLEILELGNYNWGNNYGNLIKSIDLKNNTNLVELDLTGNNIKELDLSNNTKLEKLYLEYNQLTNLDVSNNIKLIDLRADYNQLTSLDLKNNLNLKKLSLGRKYTYNNLDSYFAGSGVSKVNHSNQIDNLDLNNNINLEELYVAGNNLKSLDLSKNVNLIFLDVSHNSLYNLNLENNINLSRLAADGIFLESINLNNNNKLVVLSLSSNLLTNLNISNLSNLIALNLDKNKFSFFDVDNLNLEELRMSYNELVKVELSGALALKQLYLGNNQLTSLDVSKNTLLKYLDVYNNKLSKIDASNNLELTSMSLYNNPYKEEIYVYTGQTFKVGNNVKIPSHLNWSVPTWSSKNNNIVQVDLNGVKAVGVGIIELEGNVSGKYTTTSVVNVVEITSNKYKIDEENKYIYVGEDKDIDVIKDNINVSNEDISIDIDNNKLYVKHDEEIIKVFDIVSISSEKYDLSKDYIYTINSELDLDDIVIIGGNKVINDDKLQIKYGDFILREFVIVSISSEKYDLSKDYIYVDNNELNLEYIDVTGGKKVINNNVLQIKYDDKIVKEYDIVSISSKRYDLSKDYIFVGFNFINDIIVVNGMFELNENKLLIKYNDIILKEYDLLSIKLSNYKVYGKNIVVLDEVSYNDFIKNIIVSNGVTYKIFNNDVEVNSGNIVNGMIINLYYDNDIYEYVITDKDEYIELDDSINIDQVNSIIKDIDINTSISDIISKINTNGIVSVIDKDNNVLGSGSLKTGDKIRIELSGEVVIYKISVKGDVNGDGKCNVNDVFRLSNYCLNSSSSLDGEEYIIAGDINNNGKIDINDIIKLVGMIIKG